MDPAAGTAHEGFGDGGPRSAAAGAGRGTEEGAQTLHRPLDSEPEQDPENGQNEQAGQGNRG